MSEVLAAVTSFSEVGKIWKMMKCVTREHIPPGVSVMTVSPVAPALRGVLFHTITPGGPMPRPSCVTRPNRGGAGLRRHVPSASTDQPGVAGWRCCRPLCRAASAGAGAAGAPPLPAGSVSVWCSPGLGDLQRSEEVLTPHVTRPCATRFIRPCHQAVSPGSPGRVARPCH